MLTGSHSLKLIGSPELAEADSLELIIADLTLLTEAD